MPKYLIERDIPRAGQMSAADLQQAASRSCGVLKNLGPEIQWVQSYVTGDRIYCIYNAASEQLVRDHAEQSGFPATRIEQVNAIIDPTTAEARESTAPG